MQNEVTVYYGSSAAMAAELSVEAVDGFGYCAILVTTNTTYNPEFYVTQAEAANDARALAAQMGGKVCFVGD